MLWITEDFKKKLSEKIAAFESRTSIEFVPVVTERSSTYVWPRACYSLLYGTGLYFAVSGYYKWVFNFPHFLVWLALSAAVLAFFSIPYILRRALPPSLLGYEVQKRAVEAFALEEVFATRQRTGVLVFISLLEHRVFILADKGLNAVVPKERWQAMGAELAKDFNRHKAGDSFLTALDKLVDEVAPHFPPSSENPNELPDHLRKH